MKRIFTIITALFSVATFAQDQYVFDGSVDGTSQQTCNGFVIDSGGQGGTGYGNNESFTVTFCPDQADEIMNATFNLFDLANSAACNSGTAQNPVYDYMSIYDGDDTSAPTLGTYTGNELLGTTVQATTLNPTGCLTFEFTSNNVCSGQFSISLSCATPCQNPVAGGIIVNGDAPDSIAVCVDEIVNFAEQGSFGQPGFNIASYQWVFRDGATANTQNASHSFSQPGEYKVLLFVTDDNTNTPDGQPCQNLNLLELQVLVATPPTFENFPNDTTLCIGENIDLSATPSIWPVTWSGFPGTNTVDDGCLYDTLLGVAQTIPLFQGGFSPGQTIDNVSDLESICLDMEHSFMGDLVVQIKCPNGTIVTLHQQGGGGTQIGEPVPTDDVDCATGANQGVPYQYCWDQNATDTWVEWVDAQGGFGLTLPAGNYEPLDPLTGLMGCPMNGVWELIVTDNWGADDGTVFGFGLNFDPALYPPVTVFTPQIGNLSDSSLWAPGGAFVTSTSADGNVINVEPTTDGVYNYTYSVTDDFGCTSDSTVTIIVNPLADADAGMDTVICSGDASNVNLNGSIGGAGAGCSYSLILDDTFGDGWNGNTIDVTTGAGTTNYTVVGDQNIIQLVVAHGETIVLDFNNTGTFISECEITLQDGQGNVIYEDGMNFTDPSNTAQNITADCFGGMSFEWSPAGMVSDATIPNPLLNINAPQTFTLTVYPTGHPLCATTDDVNISFSAAGDAGTNGLLTVCSDGAPVDLFTSIGGTPDAGGVWKNAAGVVVPMPYVPSTYPAGVYTYEIDNAGCIATSTVTVTEVEISSLSSITDADCGTACNGEIDITPSGGQGSYQFSQDNGNNWQASNIFSNLCPGGYSIIIEDDLGCLDTVGRTIGEINVPTITSVVPTNVTCFGADDGEVVISGTNLTNFSIDAGVTTQGNGTFTGLAPGVYVIQVDNGFGCNLNANLTINEPDQLQMEFISNDTIICPGSALWLTCSAQGGSSAYSYEWTRDGVIVGNTKDLSINPTVIGDATYCVTVSEQCGSVPADTCVSVTNPLNIMPRLSGSPITGCYPVESTFNNMSTNIGDIAQVEWNFGDGTTGTSFGANSISHSYNEAGVFDVSMKVTSVYGCTYDTVYTAYVEAYEYPIANFSNDPASPSMYDANTTFSELASPDVVDWNWDFGPLATPSTSSQMNPDVIYPDAEFGTYTATLVVTNANGCTDTSSYDVIVQSEVLIYAPNSFTPDGDVYNEEWQVYIQGIDVYDFDLLVYNRWGEIVWESHDASIGWDGKFGGKIVQDGTYVWVVRTKDLENDEKYTFKGTVTVLR